MMYSSFSPQILIPLNCGPKETTLCCHRTSFSVCCSPTQMGPKEFRWTTVSTQNGPTCPRRRQFSLQFSRQTSKASVRSLPSPKALGRRRRGLVRFQTRRSPGPTADTLQLPDPEYEHEFQGIAGNEEEEKEENTTTHESTDSIKAPSQNSEKK